MKNRAALPIRVRCVGTFSLKIRIRSVPPRLPIHGSRMKILGSCLLSLLLGLGLV